MTAIINFEGYTLFEWGECYKSLINDEWIRFDSAAQWVNYIKMIKYGK